ncbi:hypothetical protein [Shewanella glacialipiscicola]
MTSHPKDTIRATTATDLLAKGRRGLVSKAKQAGVGEVKFDTKY